MQKEQNKRELRILQTLDQTNSQTDKADNNKGQNKRIIDDGADKRTDPRDSGRNESSDITKNSCNGGSRFSGINNLPSYLN